MKVISTSEVCSLDEIAAYVDGELSTRRTTELESHLRACDDCSRLVREQRQFLSALSASLSREGQPQLPENFAETVTLNAESSVMGLRHPNERFNAFLICAVLFMFSALALGGETFNVASAAGAIIEKVVSVVKFVIRSIGNIAFAAAVVARSLASRFDSGGLSITSILIILLATILVSSRRMIRRRST